MRNLSKFQDKQGLIKTELKNTKHFRTYGNQPKRIVNKAFIVEVIMGEQTKLRKILENLIEKQDKDKKNSPSIFKNIKTLKLKASEKKEKKPIEKQQPKIKIEPKTPSSTLEKKLPDKEQSEENSTLYANVISKNQLKEKNKNTHLLKEALKKAHISNKKTELKTIQQTMNEETLKTVESKKIQMDSKSGVQFHSSPLQIHLMRSESLRIAQEKIKDLEENIQELRQKNEALISASRILKEKNETITSKLKVSENHLDQQKNSFKEEKNILLSTIEDAKKQIERFKNKTQELEDRLSSDLYGIRARENSLESRIEILKMENSVLQKEKDKKIIQIKKQIQKTEDKLDRVYKKNKSLQIMNQKLQESSHRAVSALRATIYNLEGVKEQTEK